MTEQVFAARGLLDARVETLQEAGDNPREISAPRFEALKYSLEKDPSMLRARPVIATPDGTVVAGNMRLRAACELGWETIPAYIEELDDERRREWMLRDNQEYGDWVPSELAALVAIHETEGGDMGLLGFDDQALADLKKIGQPDLPDGGEAPNDPVPATWGVVIDCDDEAQQAALLEEFAARDLKCRALVI